MKFMNTVKKYGFGAACFSLIGSNAMAASVLPATDVFTDANADIVTFSGWLLPVCAGVFALILFVGLFKRSA